MGAIESEKDLLDWERAHSWHPFTQMRDWCDPGHEPLVIERGEGAWLIDSKGRRYVDGNSSIWTNIHGHNHPVLNAAITGQLERIAHSSYLGFTHKPGIRLAKCLSDLVGNEALPRVFFSDDGSTAIECAAKMALQFWQLEGEPQRDSPRGRRDRRSRAGPRRRRRRPRGSSPSSRGCPPGTASRRSAS